MIVRTLYIAMNCNKGGSPTCQDRVGLNSVADCYIEQDADVVFVER